MEKLLNDILQELKWQSKVLEKLMEAQAVKSTNYMAMMKPLLDNLERVASALPKENKGAEVLREMIQNMKEKEKENGNSHSKDRS